MSDQVLSQWWKRVSSISSHDTNFTDLVLVAGDGERYVCHQLVLAMTSPILYSLLLDQKGEEVVINLPEVDGRVVKLMLGVLYNRNLPTTKEGQEELDKLAQVLGVRVRQGKSNIVFNNDSGDVEQFYYEPYLEEQTTFLYVEDVKAADILTLDESETYDLNASEDNQLNITAEKLKPKFASFDSSIGYDDKENHSLKEENNEEKVLIVPIDSQEDIIHETVEFNNVADSKPKLSSTLKYQSQPCCLCLNPTINHRARDMDSSSWSYRCCLCTKSNIKTAAAFVKHITVHGSNKCELCQKTKKSHKENGNFFCCQCKKKVLGSKLCAHVRKHIEPKKLDKQTDLAQMGLLNEQKDYMNNCSNNLMTQTAPSSGAPRLICPSCSKSMTRRHYIKHHKASCSKERVLKCETCGREGFCNLSTLQDHIRAKHTQEKPFECEYCNKAFPAASHLAHHRMKKHRVNSKGELQPKIVFPCNYCGKILTTKPKLLAHVKVIHQGIKDFTCNSCQKSFSSKSNLDIHIGSVHTGNLPYKCEFCSKSFARKNLLSAHRQTAHQFIEAQSVHQQGPL